MKKFIIIPAIILSLSACIYHGKPHGRAPHSEMKANGCHGHGQNCQKPNNHSRSHL